MLRQVISQYTLDKQRAPQTLDDLVQAGYLKSIPVDPFTGRADWVPETEPENQDPPLPGTGPGNVDVHSDRTSKEKMARVTAVGESRPVF